MGYKGKLISVHPNGYVHENTTYGATAHLKGFVDELRFVTKFSNSNDWYFDEGQSFPTEDIYGNCNGMASFNRTNTYGFNFAGTISGELGGKDKGKVSASVTGGYNQATSVSENFSLSCNSEVFKVVNNDSPNLEGGPYGSFSEGLENDPNQKRRYTKVHYSSLMLNRIGDERLSAGQSSQPYTILNRDIDEQLANLQKFQRSLDESNVAEAYIDSDEGRRYRYVSSHAHQPFYSSPGEVLPEEIRDDNGTTHKASLVFSEIISDNNQSTERVLPLIEVLYNPGITSTYRWYTHPPAHRFELRFNNAGTFGRVTLKFPPININWKSQQLMDTKTFGIRTVSNTTGSNFDYLSRVSNSDFRVKEFDLSSVDLSQEYPITNVRELFYITPLDLENPVAALLDFQINTFIRRRPGASRLYRKKCLSITGDNRLTMLDCNIQDATVRKRWKYGIHSEKPSIDNIIRSPDYRTLCLTEEPPIIKCLYRTTDNRVDIGNYNDENMDRSSFKWDVFDFLEELAEFPRG